MSRVCACLSLMVLLLAAGTGDALGQCILANPSFEIPGSGEQLFGGWNQFGLTGSTAIASHGQVAARATGPDTGEWGISGYGQPLSTGPGERWSAAVTAWHSASNPLTGQSNALLGIEWRDTGGLLIDGEWHVVADASTPPEEFVRLTVESGPAPAGTATAFLFLLVLQGPADPTPVVFFDQATFDNLGPPTLEELQWSDFGGRTIGFGNRTWRVKGPGFYGPGPNYFCADANCVWVDPSDRLHMTIQNTGGTWFSSEVTLEEALGYGDYVFTIQGRLDQWHRNVVVGLFLWEYGACYQPENGWWNPYNEIDVELSRWGDPANDIAQFVAQPYDWPGNINRFDPTQGDPELTSHAFRWLPDRIEFRSWRGGPQDESPENSIHTWEYTGPHIPRPEQPRVHINLWQFSGPPTSNQELIIDAFTFEPACFGPLCLTAAADLPAAGSAIHLAAAVPNPFSSRTRIRFALATGGHTEIAIFDVAGRLVRTLVSEFKPAGGHQVVWDGHDRAGNRVAPGVYLYRMRAGDAVEARHIVVLD